MTDKFIHLGQMQYSNFSLSLSFTVTDNISLQNITKTIGAYSHTPYIDKLVLWSLNTAVHTRFHVDINMSTSNTYSS